MNPNGAHYNVRSSFNIVRHGLGNRPDMVWQVRGSVGEVGGEEEWDWINQTRGGRSGDQQRCNSMAGSIAAVSSKAAADRMGGRERGGFCRSIKKLVVSEVRPWDGTVVLGDTLTLATGIADTRSSGCKSNRPKAADLRKGSQRK